MANQSEIADVASLLFGGDAKVMNIKCFVGDGPFTEDELRREFGSAIRQRRDAEAKVLPHFHDDAPKSDIRALITALQR